MAATGPSLSGSWEDIPDVNTAQPNVAQPDNVVKGYAWTQQRGYFILPDDARLDVLGIEVWHHDSKSWKTVLGTGLDEDSGSVKSYDTWTRWNDDGDRRGPTQKDGDVPEWDGKSEHRTTYFRRIDLWASTTGVPAKQRGCRLLQKLKGEAFEKLENVDPKDLLVEDSIEKFKNCIIEVYEPIEDYRIGKIMDAFLDDFHRPNGQEIVDYNLAWDREVMKVVKVAGELNEKWAAHLFLKKMRLQPQQKSQVLTGTLGKYTVDAIKKAALTTFPSMKDAFARQPGAKPAFNTRKPPYKGRTQHNGRYGKGRKPWKAHEADQGEDEEPENSEQDEQNEEESEDDADESEEEPQEEEQANEDMPPELDDALAEAEAFMTRARKQRAEVVKARGFFKKEGGPSGSANTSALKARLPCSKCKKLGHWHKDKRPDGTPMCSMANQPFPSKSGKGNKPQKKKKKPKKKYRKRYPKRRRTQAHDVHVVTLNGLELPHVAYVDTACARCVVGQAPADGVISFCKAHNWPYKLVTDHEPFRFGPGRRIWSEMALIIAVIWGGVTVVIKFSIVPPLVPFLISKYVFKRLRANIDLDVNELTLKGFPQPCIEPLYDLVSGHVAVEITKKDCQPPALDAEAFGLCEASEEVTVVDPLLRDKLADVKTFDNKTHVVQIPSMPTVSFDMTADDTESERELPPLEQGTETEPEQDTDDDDNATEFLTKLCDGDRPIHARTRAAPMFNELAPGWRARAVDLVPSYLRRNAEGFPDDMDSAKPCHKDDLTTDHDSLESVDDEEGIGGRAHGDSPTRKPRRQKGQLHLGHEERGVDRNCKEGTGNLEGSSGEGHSDNSPGEDSSKPQGSGISREPKGSNTQGTWINASCESGGGVSSARHRDPSKGNSTTDDTVDPRGRGEGQSRMGVCRPEAVGESGSLNSDERCSTSEPEAPSGGVADSSRGPALLRWANSFVTNLTGRTATLVSRVLHTGNAKPFIAPDNEFQETTQGKETWTQITDNAEMVTVNIEGLDDPVWRQTVYADSGELIESTPLPSDVKIKVPKAPSSIKTTVWYGATTTKQPKIKKTLVKGMRAAAAVLLLEAMVLLSAGASWSGSWTQYMYGTGTADVWEIFGRDNLTNVAWKQGWRPLVPMQTANIQEPHCLEYLTNTLDEKAPRFVVMESPSAIWSKASRHMPQAKHAARTSTKRFNESASPFLEVVHEVALTQLNDNKDFLIELPLTNRILRHPVAKEMAANESFYVTNGPGWNRTKATWWLSSSPDVIRKLDVPPKTKPTKLIKDVMIGFADTLYRKEPQRIQSLIRSIDTRLRGCGLMADDCMVQLAVHLGGNYREQVFAIMDEDTDIPEGGIEFDLPPELHKRIPKSLLQSVRRLHFNSGHPPNAELERIVRLSGGSDLARAAVKGIKCTICRKAAPPKSQKPAKARTNIGQFNETILADIGYEKDASGATHGWLIMVDEGTDWTVCKYLGPSKATDIKTAKELYDKVELGWIDWAGPPDTFVADGERGFAAEEFAQKLGRAGCLYQPTAGYAPGRKAKLSAKSNQYAQLFAKPFCTSA